MHSQTIEGVGSISGGEYERISIEGVGNSKGDITVKQLDIEGVFKSNGKIKAETIECEGVAEFSDTIRAKVLEGLEFMGVYFDPDLNNMRGMEVYISHPYSPVKVLVIPTDEEVMLARDTVRVAGL